MVSCGLTNTICVLQERAVVKPVYILFPDILIDITVIKPRPEMNYKELGLDVWNWPYLCVRQINPGSIFEHTPIQETDQIAAINDIDCSKMRAKEFATCVSDLPKEITITMIRRKHRYTASYS
jgi:hypothetical protein